MKRRFPRFRFTLRGGGGGRGKGEGYGYTFAILVQVLLFVHLGYRRLFRTLALILGYHLTIRFKAFDKDVVGCKVLKFKRTGTSQNIGEKLFMGIK